MWLIGSWTGIRRISGQPFSERRGERAQRKGLRREMTSLRRRYLRFVFLSGRAPLFEMLQNLLFTRPPLNIQA